MMVMGQHLTQGTAAVSANRTKRHSQTSTMQIQGVFNGRPNFVYKNFISHFKKI
jgi:hypothetical protein